MIQETADKIVNGLRGSPGLLAVVVLNVVAIVAMIWFLREIGTRAGDERSRLLEVIRECIVASPLQHPN